MAIAHFNVAIVGRSSGKSSVHAAAYASRTDLIDERTGLVHRYARKGGDLVMSFIWLPKGAPERLRDRAALWNAVEQAETRKNSQLARRIILALPHELTAEQQQQLLKDYARENFTRKGLAADVSIHKPDPQGDDRNFHAHILIPTRFIDKAGLGKKDRESNERETLQAWRDDWEKKVNKQLERYGHATRISMKTLEAQGIDRTPQIHLGQGASALDRKGIQTERADDLRAIANENDRGRGLANDNNRYKAGKEFARDVIRPPQTIDRETQNAQWQEAVNAAGIAYAEEQRRQFLEQQQVARAAMEQEGRAMAERHGATWTDALQRHAAEITSGYQPGSIQDAGNAAAGSFSFLLSFFTSLADSFTRSATGAKSGPAKPRGKSKGREQAEQQRRDRQQREQQQAELEAILAEQARERQQWERRKAFMLERQAQALGQFEQELSQRPLLQKAFEQESPSIKPEVYDRLSRMAEQKEARQGRDLGGRDGPELV